MTENDDVQFQRVFVGLGSGRLSAKRRGELLVHIERELTERLVGTRGEPRAVHSLRGQAWLVRFTGRWAVAAVVLAAFVVSLGLLVVRLRESDTRPASRAAGIGSPWTHIDTGPLLTGHPGTSLRWLPLAIRVGQASVIARCTMVELTETHLVCKVTRVIYGRALAGMVRVLVESSDGARLILKNRLDREPTDDEVKAEHARLVNFEVGGDAILFVDHARAADHTLVWRLLGAWYDVPSKNPLDEREKEIVEVIRTGAHLTPSLRPEDLAIYVRSSERVVRASLTKIGSTSAEWTVASVLYVARFDRRPITVPFPKEKLAEESDRLLGTTITVGLDVWRLRAETVVNHQADQDPDRGSTEEDIQAEFDRMVQAELVVSREAILFLKPGETAQDGVTYRVVGILHEDPQKARPIDEFEKTIRNTIEKGLHQVLYL